MNALSFAASPFLVNSFSTISNTASHSNNPSFAHSEISHTSASSGGKSRLGRTWTGLFGRTSRSKRRAPSQPGLFGRLSRAFSTSGRGRTGGDSSSWLSDTTLPDFLASGPSPEASHGYDYSIAREMDNHFNDDDLGSEISSLHDDTSYTDWEYSSPDISPLNTPHQSQIHLSLSGSSEPTNADESQNTPYISSSRFELLPREPIAINPESASYKLPLNPESSVQETYSAPSSRTSSDKDSFVTGRSTASRKDALVRTASVHGRSSRAALSDAALQMSPAGESAQDTISVPNVDSSQTSSQTSEPDYDDPYVNLGKMDSPINPNPLTPRGTRIWTSQTSSVSTVDSYTSQISDKPSQFTRFAQLDDRTNRNAPTKVKEGLGNTLQRWGQSVSSLFSRSSNSETSQRTGKLASDVEAELYGPRPPEEEDAIMNKWYTQNGPGQGTLFSGSGSTDKVTARLSYKETVSRISEGTALDGIIEPHTEEQGKEEDWFSHINYDSDSNDKELRVNHWRETKGSSIFTVI
ncbi:uncharacterized protein L201_001702 [Kwoniella dendrophila CBS 6074]|uniref:Uncharacterized protein n=1 Tax=Kwoniella dendrophila CBS 6074 TaxID=1295534 RepID=A0AAX4JPL9_9TREE